MQMSALVTESHARFRSLARKVDCFVAVCQWVADVLQANGISNSKLILVRQGLAYNECGGDPSNFERRESRSGWLRLGYFGRLDPTKGVDVLIEAFRQLPEIPARLDIYGIRQPGSEAYVAEVERAAQEDQRVRILSTIETLSSVRSDARL